MKKRIAGLLLSILVATGLLTALSATDLIAPKAAAATIASACKVHGRVLCVNKTSRKLYYMQDGKVVMTMDARFGCASTPTRNGTFHVYRKSRHWVSSIYHTAMPFSMFFSGGQAVHYSSDFARRGYAGCSHGCVNIRNWSKISWVYAHIRVGDRVVVFRG